MVQAAKYIHSRLENENLLSQAFSHSPQRGTQHFQLVIVGHSLGAGTAAILALLLRQQYPAENMHCYAYSPPGGLLRYINAAYYDVFFFC
jgi:sn1-specific diacylglycerol lipase